MEYKISLVTQLAQVIKSRRKSLGLTQAQMGSKLGISQRVYSRNESHPERVHFERIAAILAELDMELVIRERDDSTLDQNPSDLEPW